GLRQEAPRALPRSRRAPADGARAGGAGEMKDEARAVIIGTGICGSSIAYHLGQLGWKEVVVLDRGPLAGGTTSHAPGLVGQYRSNPSLLRLLMYSVSLYRELELDGQPGF